MATLCLVSEFVNYRSKYPERQPLPLDLSHASLPDLALLLSDCFYDLVEAEKEQFRIKQRFEDIISGERQIRTTKPGSNPKFDRQNRRVA